MHTIYADYSVSMSEFKKNPAQVLRTAGEKPVAVLSHNRPAFYMVSASPASRLARASEGRSSSLRINIASECSFEMSSFARLGETPGNQATSAAARIDCPRHG